MDIGDKIRKNVRKKNQINKIWFFLLAFALLIPLTSAANVTLANKVVNQSQTFDINILIDPLGKPISGAQLDIAFNASMFKVNSISEGKLFNQNGATTYFSEGVLNNTTGNVKNIFNVIIGNHSISSPGVFIIVNMTAIGAGGSSWINLSNVKISDPDALPVTVESMNGSIKINSPPVLAVIGNKKINKGQELNFTISATDQNGGPLSYSASNLPPGAKFNQMTGTFVWASPLIGKYQKVHFEVSDGILIDSENITITVSDYNNVPTFIAIPANGSVFNENDTIRIKVTANDLDNDALNYIIKIDGEIVSTLPYYNWTTSYTSSGNHVINISVSDGLAMVSTSISVYINNVYPPYDVNENGLVEVGDFAIIGLHFYEKTFPPYPRYDVNMDGEVNTLDMVIVGLHYGEKN